MSLFELSVVDGEGQIVCESKGEDFCDLVVKREYVKGDRICFKTDEKNQYVRIQVDDAINDALIYLTDDFTYVIPFDEARISMSPRIFTGETHYIYAEKPTKSEVCAYRNLALNPADQHTQTEVYGTDTNTFTAFPHASANVETRGESVFAARNAIDGVRANLSHGEWPYESWGINRRDDAELRVDFGINVKSDKIVLYTRADFPHDNWWREVTLSFSDGSELRVSLKKSIRPHVITFEEKEFNRVVLKNMIKADDPSPFPALTQIEVYGVPVL